MMGEQNNRLGAWLMIATSFVFAMQDGISRHLAGSYNVYMVVMIRYWFFAAFVIVMAIRASGGVRAAARTAQPALQIGRGVLLAGEICVAVYGFTLLGLIDSLEKDARGCIKVHPGSFQTSHPKYFAAGDAVNGGAEVVNAAAEGKMAARGIDSFISNSK